MRSHENHKVVGTLGEEGEAATKLMTLKWVGDFSVQWSVTDNKWGVV